MIEDIRLQVGIAKTIEEWQRIHNIETPDFGKLGRRDHPLRSLAAEIISEIVEFQCEPDVYGLPMDDEDDEDDEGDEGEAKEWSAEPLPVDEIEAMLAVAKEYFKEGE